MQFSCLVVLFYFIYEVLLRKKSKWNFANLKLGEENRGEFGAGYNELKTPFPLLLDSTGESTNLLADSKMTLWIKIKLIA